MQEQANLEAACSEITVELTLCGLVKLGHGLDFHDKLFIDDHIEPLSAELFIDLPPLEALCSNAFPTDLSDPRGSV